MSGGGLRLGWVATRAVARAGGGVVLEIEPDRWWRGWRDGRLVVAVVRVEAYVERDGSVAWAVVEGWRVFVGGGRGWTRDLVRVEALPAELLAGVWS